MFHKYKAADKVQERVLLEDIFPHVIHAVFIGENIVPGSGIYASTFSPVKGQENGIFTM